MSQAPRARRVALRAPPGTRSHAQKPFSPERLNLPSLTSEEKHAFRLIHPYAIYILATDTPLMGQTFDPRTNDRLDSFGHNQRTWPIRIGGTSSWVDEVTSGWDRNPLVKTRVKWRLWVRRLDEQQSLIAHVTEVIRRAADLAGYRAMNAGFVDIGPNFRALSFGDDVRDLAKRLGIFHWTDLEIAAFVKTVLRAAKRSGVSIISPRGQKIHDPDFIRLADHLAERAAQEMFRTA